MNSIPLFKVHLPNKVFKPLKAVLKSGFIGQGKEVEKYEELLRNYFKYNHVLTLNNCTASLTLACRLAEVTFGDEVISTPLTCFATNTAILANGAKIRWADTNPLTCNIDLDDIANKVTNNTKAIMVVHWGGYPIDVNQLAYKVLQKTGGYLPPIIEDCAHAFGATIKDQFVGTFGNYSCFSLQAIKHQTTIDGGLLLTPSDQYKRAKLLRWYGIDREERGRTDFRVEIDVPEWGYKYHMNDVCASIGQVQLQYINKILKKHRTNAKYYNKHLSRINGIQLLTELPDSNPSYWLYTFLVDRRTDFRRKMKELGVITSKVHERNDLHSCCKDFIAPLPMLDSINDKIINIPVGWWVTKENREYIVDCIKKGW